MMRTKRERPDLLAPERERRERGFSRICGVDEAGRGPLAGPVSVAACIMPAEDIVPGVNDSKQLTERQRERCYEEIIRRAVAWNVVLIDAETIDRINILEATKSGMRQAVGGLSVRPDLVLVDAVRLDLDVPAEGIVHGDALCYSIACASVLAKVTRDRLMAEYDRMYPGYGFAKHKGYGTREHMDAIARLGACPIHRESFLRKFRARREEER